MRLTTTIALGTLLIAPTHAAEISLNIEIPRINAAEYHRPYLSLIHI